MTGPAASTGPDPVRRVVVAITGASGPVYGIKALELLAAVDGVETHLVLSNAAKTTIGIESDRSVAEVEAMADHVHGARDITAPIASGSFRTAGMLVAPCSIKTLSAVATSASAELIARAADVTLKERRPLVLMVRETPLHLGHLRLMAQAVEIGAVVQPPVPAFYNQPSTIDDLVTHSVVRAIEHLGLAAGHTGRWHGG